MDQRTKILLYAGGVFGLIALFIVMSIILPPPQQPDTTPQEPKTLTDAETRFPQANPQPFRNQDVPETGTLVVTSDPDEVFVLLEATVHRHHDDPISEGEEWPINKTPLTVSSMPVGEHFLLARKPGYVIAEHTFEITTGQVTRIHVKLLPLPH